MAVRAWCKSSSEFVAVLFADGGPLDGADVAVGAALATGANAAGEEDGAELKVMGVAIGVVGISGGATELFDSELPEEGLGALPLGSAPAVLVGAIDSAETC